MAIELLTGTLDSSCGYRVNEEYQCTLKSSTTNLFSFGHMTADAEQGCPICVFRHHAILQCSPRHLEPETQVLYYDENAFSPIHLSGGIGFHTIEVFPYNNDQGESWTSRYDSMTRKFIYSNYDYSFYGKRFPVRRPMRKPSGNTSSEASMLSAIAWIQNCDRTHRCRKIGPTLLPKRIVGLDNERIFLHVSGNEVGDYACLSHCWGQVSILRTTTENIAALRSEIPWQSLPKTFQNAVTFIRGLGLKWLWIDSLCIVQDDDLDWQQQSAEMASIYRNSYITIAATRASDSEDGLFTYDSDHVYHAKQTLVTLQSRNGTKYPVFARVPLQHDRRKFPLLKRAWVYQERLLSPRVLHFAGYELIFECKDLADCECGAISIFDDVFRRPLVESKAVDPLPKGTCVNFYWPKIVVEYSHLDLTYPNDIFPALSGLVKHLCSTASDQYVAGLWRNSLLLDLLWFRVRGGRRHTPWRAPSWSWASSETHSGQSDLKFISMKEPLAEVVDAAATPLGVDPTGAISSALLVLRAHAISTQLRTLKRRNVSDDYRHYVSVGNLTFECSSHGCPPANDLGIFTPSSYPSLRYRAALNVYILQIGRENFPFDATGRAAGRSCIVEQDIRHFLIATETNDGDGTFERIGVLSIKLYKQGSSIVSRYETRPEEEFERDPQAHADRIRPIFRLFDESPKRAFTLV